MVQNAEEKGSGYFVEKNDNRITKIGNILRKTSLDELPQLINVLKGEMSLIGPRPTLLFQIKEYDKYQKQRLQMKPGITGWAQVNGRGNLNWDERIEYDIEYINNWTFFFDLKILFMTIIEIFNTKTIYSEKRPWKHEENDDKKE